MSDEQPQPQEEHTNLNADDLDVEELDEDTLSTAAGGCWDAYCGVNSRDGQDVREQTGS